MSSIQDGNWVVSTNPLHAGNGVGIVQQVRGEQTGKGVMEKVSGRILTGSENIPDNLLLSEPVKDSCESVLGSFQPTSKLVLPEQAGSPSP
jgi:hypothetical protein